MKSSGAASFIFLLGLLFLSKVQETSSGSEENIRTFLNQYNYYMAVLKRLSNVIQWEMELGKISGEKKRKAILLAKKVRDTIRKMDNKADNIYEAVKKSSKDIPEDMKRQLMLINQVGTPKGLADMTKINKLLQIMSKIYSSARVQLKVRGKTRKLQLNKGLLPIMNRVSKKNLKLLKWVWFMWRKVVGARVRPYFVKFVDLTNKGARERGYKDYGAFTRSCYDMDEDKFRRKMADLYSKVAPLYKKLHAYVRYKLRMIVGPNEVEEKGMIPAQFLGMWPAHWNHLYNMVVPYPKKKIPDVSKNLKAKGIQKKKMVQLAEKFFESIGFRKLPRAFWERSLFERKGNMPCQASALDVGQGDVRMKMPCLSPTQENLITVHHEMGHIQYYLSYLRQPFVYRLGANQGFQESVGDAIALSITTPKYLHDLGLIDQLHEDKEESINYLMKQALHKVAFLPFSYMTELWRWDVFSGKVPAERYNTYWWELRNKVMGVKAPFKRTEKDFDPGSFLHIDKNIEYISYFFSQILQYMTQKSLCKSAKHQGPLHKCSIYKSKEAGEKLKGLLSMGRSIPWQAILQAAIGENDLDVGPLLEYFRPLEIWLDNHRKQNGYTVGW